MKKIIKIFTLMMFILLVFGITTSNAKLEVDGNTSATAMINELNKNGGYLTSISEADRNSNESLLCDHRNISQVPSAKYTIKSKTSYPLSKSDGYAEAYILAATGYSKSERQNAWWYLKGQANSANDLVEIANVYESYKKSEVDLVLTVDPEATTTISGDNIVYGPLQIVYSHRSYTSGGKSYEWGGFNYAFFDDKGENISYKVQLCDDTYTPITSTEITSDDVSNKYYKVGTDEYSNDPLYIVTTDKTISKLTMKVQKNEVNYTADVYDLEGEYESDGGVNICGNCRENLVGSLADAIGKSEKVARYNNILYKWTSTTYSDDDDWETVQKYNRYLLSPPGQYVNKNTAKAIDTAYSTPNGGSVSANKNKAAQQYATVYCWYDPDVGRILLR